MKKKITLFIKWTVDHLEPWPSGSVGQNVVPCTKRLQVRSWSGHIPRLWVQSLVQVHMGGNRLMLLSWCFSLISIYLPIYLSIYLSIYLCLSLFLSLSLLFPSPFLSKINKHILGWGFFFYLEKSFPIGKSSSDLKGISTNILNSF